MADDRVVLMRRLARIFDRVPNLAYVSVSRTSMDRIAALAVCLDWASLDRPDWPRIMQRAERVVRRVARCLRIRAVIDSDCTWPPRPGDVVIYRRKGPTWARWRRQAARTGVPTGYTAACGWSHGPRGGV